MPLGHTLAGVRRPKLWNKLLTDDQIILFYFINNLFRIDEVRWPQQDEVLEIFTLLEKKSKIPQAADYLFTSFAKPGNELTKWAQERVQDRVAGLKKRVNDAFKDWIGQDSVAHQRATILGGVPERLALPTKVDQRDKNWRDSATKNTVYLKPHQLILLSIIAANCENKDGTPMTPDNRYKLVKKCLVGGAKGPEEIVTRFATAREGTAKDMKEWIAKSGYKDLFFQNTQAFLDIHKEKLEEMNLRVRIRKATEAAQRYPVPTVGPVTTAIGSLSLQAPTNPTSHSYHPLAQSPYQEKRKAQPQPSEQAESSKRRETGAGQLSNPQRPGPQPSSQDPRHAIQPYAFQPHASQPHAFQSHASQPHASQQEPDDVDPLYDASDNEQSGPSSRRSIDLMRRTPPEVPQVPQGRVPRRSIHPGQPAPEPSQRRERRERRNYGPPPPPPPPSTSR